MPAEFTHDTVKMYFTLYLPLPTPVHPLDDGTTDLEVILLSSIDTCGLGEAAFGAINGLVCSKF